MTTARSSFTALALAGAVALGAASGGAHAGTATSNLDVSATVSANCTISTAPVAFGGYDPVSANASTALDASGSVTVTCTQGSAATVTLGQGANADTGSSDAAPARRLNDGGTNFLAYDLYSDEGRSVVWGNDATTDVAHTGTGTAVALDVYGSIDAAQNVPAGSYTDTVVATVTF